MNSKEIKAFGAIVVGNSLFILRHSSDLMKNSDFSAYCFNELWAWMESCDSQTEKMTKGHLDIHKTSLM